MRIVSLLFLYLLSLYPSQPWATLANGLSPAEKHGKRLYLKMDAPSADPIIAYLGQERFEDPGAAVPWVNFSLFHSSPLTVLV